MHICVLNNIKNVKIICKDIFIYFFIMHISYNIFIPKKHYPHLNIINIYPDFIFIKFMEYEYKNML